MSEPLRTFPFVLDREVTVRVHRYSPGRRGRVSGPPEDCYEAEASEIEADAIDASGHVYELTAEELAAVRDEYEDHLHGEVEP